MRQFQPVLVRGLDLFVARRRDDLETVEREAPLVKALAMLPVLFLNPAFPTQSDAWQNKTNAEWDIGYQFLYSTSTDL